MNVNQTSSVFYTSKANPDFTVEKAVISGEYVWFHLHICGNFVATIGGRDGRHCNDSDAEITARCELAATTRKGLDRVTQNAIRNELKIIANRRGA